MNNKIMAAGVVVALCAVALIGVGYAYTATFENGDNVISSDAHYIVISKESSAVTAATVTVLSTELIVPFDSETKKSGDAYVTTYSPAAKNGVDGWTQIDTSTKYTKVIPETVTLKVDTRNAGTPGDSFSVLVTPGSVTPTTGSGIESIVVSVSQINSANLVEGKGTFTGSSSAEVSVTVALNVTITVDNDTTLNDVPVELNKLKFDMKYVIEPSA